MKKNTTFLSFFLFLFIISLTKADDSSPSIKYVVDASLNGTATFVQLEDIKDDYVYFTFDLDYRYKKASFMEQNKVYFHITTSYDLSKANKFKFSRAMNIGFGLTNKKWEDIKKQKDISSIFWMNSIIIDSQKGNNGDYEYYIQINFIYKTNTLILRVPKINQEKGDITIENIINLPENLKKNSEIKNNYYHNNYHHNNHLRNTNHHNSHHNNNNHHHNKHNNNHNYNDHYIKPKGVFALVGAILGQVWIVILILYCLVNRRKKPILGLSVAVNNPQLNQNFNNVQIGSN